MNRPAGAAPRSVVVVGASIAGCRAAETLRQLGYDGTVTVVGDEDTPPYDRPPLSKQVLAGDWPAERIALPVYSSDLELTWRLGTRAASLDLAGGRVGLADGSSVDFDGLVIATGAAARTLPLGRGLAGVHTLRTLADATALRADLDRVPGRVVVIGAGFIGAEVAATCRGRGLAVTMVEALPVPLGRVLGDEVGAMVGEIHRDQGVDLRVGVGVAAIEGGTRVERVVLGDGSVIDADVVVVGVGVSPSTGWLEGSGLVLDDGVVCDETCLAAPGVVAAGDVARWPHRLFGESLRVEHWDNAIEQGAHAARRLLEGDGPGTPFAPVPWFWSDQYDRKIQLAGRSAGADRVQVVAGSTADRRLVALYARGDRVTGVLGVNRPAVVVKARGRIADGLSWDEAVEAYGDH